MVNFVCGQRTVTSDLSKRGVSTLHPSGFTGPDIDPINYRYPAFPAHGKSSRKTRPVFPSSDLFNGGESYVLEEQEKSRAESLGYEEQREADREEMHRTQERATLGRGLWDALG